MKGIIFSAVILILGSSAYCEKTFTKASGKDVVIQETVDVEARIEILNQRMDHLRLALISLVNDQHSMERYPGLPDLIRDWQAEIQSEIDALQGLVTK